MTCAYPSGQPCGPTILPTTTTTAPKNVIDKVTGGGLPFTGHDILDALLISVCLIGLAFMCFYIARNRSIPDV